MSDASFEAWQSDPSNLKALARWLSLVQARGLQREAVAALAPLASAELPSDDVAAAVYTGLVQLEMDLNHAEQAKDWLNQLSQVDPNGFRPEYFKGQLLQAAGQYEAAKKHYVEAGKRNKGHADTWRRLVRCCVLTRAHEQATKLLLELRKLSWPPAVERQWLYNQGCVYQQDAQYALAMICFARLIQDCLERGVPQSSGHTKARLAQVSKDAPLQALKEITSLLEANDLRPFPTAGTLLGWWRENQFLSHDKDIDITLPPGDDWERAFAVLAESSKFVPVFNEMGYSNLKSFAHRETELVIDVCHHELVGNDKVQCVWRVPGLPDESCRRTLQDSYELTRDTWLGVEFWRPENPDAFLTALYGDWRTPVVGFDTVISGHHVVGFPDVVRCFAYNRLANWLTEGRGEKAVSYLGQILKKDPLDPIAHHIQLVAAKRAAASKD